MRDIDGLNAPLPLVAIIAADWSRDEATVEIDGRRVAVRIDWDGSAPFVMFGSSPTTTDEEDAAIADALATAHAEAARAEREDYRWGLAS